MKRLKPVWIILLSFVLQLVILFWMDSDFVKLSDMSISFVEQRMKEDGMPPNQQQHLSSALRGMRFDVSHYVRALGLQLIMLNALTLMMLFANERKSLRPDDEA